MINRKIIQLPESSAAQQLIQISIPSLWQRKSDVVDQRERKMRILERKGYVNVVHLVATATQIESYFTIMSRHSINGLTGDGLMLLLPCWRRCQRHNKKTIRSAE
jgi:hypothetical protein